MTAAGRGPHTTAADGTFRLIGLPGRGLLCARAGNGTYRMGVGGGTNQGNAHDSRPRNASHSFMTRFS